MTSAAPHEPTITSRQRMIDTQLRRRGIRDARVLGAMASVPRELFVETPTVAMAYEDTPLPIAAGQTISQPYMVAYMAEALQLEPGDVVLEIGTGSGYAAAVLSMIAGRVYTIERVPELAETARERLQALGYRQIEVKCGDGTLGWPEHAPFQAIVCAASGPSVPQSLLDQLDVYGRLVMPIDTPHGQTLVRVTRHSHEGFVTTDLGAVRFVPLIGEQGWSQ
jgi:protein-L-isoaspartate(D-aspartate) O-methyltransferase